MSETKENPGQFKAGNQAAKGHGRPPKAVEAAYARIEQEIATLNDYRLIVTRQVADAQGRQFVYAEGQYRIARELDPESTPGDRARAATWLADRVRGKPVEYTRDVTDDEAPAEQLPEYTAEQLGQIGEVIELVTDIDPAELRAIIAKARAVQSDSGGTRTDPGGVDAAGEATKTVS